MQHHDPLSQRLTFRGCDRAEHGVAAPASNSERGNLRLNEGLPFFVGSPAKVAACGRSTPLTPVPFSENGCGLVSSILPGMELREPDKTGTFPKWLLGRPRGRVPTEFFV